MKSFKKLFTSKSKSHSPESSFKVGGMGSLKILDVTPPPEEDSEKLKKAFQGLHSFLSFFLFLLFMLGEIILVILLYGEVFLQDWEQMRRELLRY